MENLKIPIRVWLAACIASILSSCGQLIPILSTNTELTLERDQNWSLQITVVLPGEAGLLASQYEAILDQTILEFRSKGVIAFWELLPQRSNETNISYKMNFSGEGYDVLNQTILESKSAVVLDPSVKNQVIFNFNPHSSLFTQGQHNTFTLNCSNIVTTNGTLLGRGSAQWINPTTTMTAVASISPNLTWLWITLLGIGGVGFVIAGFGVGGKLSIPQELFSSRTLNHPNEKPSAKVIVKGKYCPQCGANNPQEAGFCINCGTQIPS